VKTENPKDGELLNMQAVQGFNHFYQYKLTFNYISTTPKRLVRYEDQSPASFFLEKNSFNIMSALGKRVSSLVLNKVRNNTCLAAPLVGHEVRDNASKFVDSLCLHLKEKATDLC